jgi:hypothetical protein
MLGRVTAALLFARNIGGSLGSAAGGALLGAALARGGAALGDVFWRVPAGAALLAVGLLASVGGLPDIRPRAEGAEALGPDAHG